MKPLAPTVIAVLALSSAGSAVAAMYGSSTQPYWGVGVLDKTLSAACQRGEFAQVQKLHLAIGYDGAKGRGVTGIAKQGWNLFDPRRLSQIGFTYHFFNDGYSNCKVYVAGTRLTR